MNLRTAARRPALWLALVALLLAVAAGGLRWWQRVHERVPPGSMLIERTDRSGVAYSAALEAD